METEAARSGPDPEAPGTAGERPDRETGSLAGDTEPPGFILTSRVGSPMLLVNSTQ